MPGKLDNGEYWKSKSWFVVGSAIDKINKELAKEYVEIYNEYKKAIDLYDYYSTYRNHKVSECASHREFLEGLK